MAKGILLVAFDYTNAHEDEFHDWYDLEHLPERQRLPGFGLCERWISVANPKVAVASYDLASLGVLSSDAYKAIAGDNLSPWSKRVGRMCTRLLRFDGEQTLPGEADSPAAAGGLLVNAMNVPPEHDAEFNEWYDNEHIPALAAVPGVLAARRFKDPKGTHRYLALYHLKAPGGDDGGGLEERGLDAMDGTAAAALSRSSADPCPAVRARGVGRRRGVRHQHRHRPASRDKSSHGR